MRRARPRGCGSAHAQRVGARAGRLAVAEAAEQLEQAAAGLGDLHEAIAELEIASNEVCAVIEARLQGGATETFALYGLASFYPAA
jgi:hypothetical protein